MLGASNGCREFCVKEMFSTIVEFLFSVSLCGLNIKMCHITLFVLSPLLLNEEDNIEPPLNVDV